MILKFVLSLQFFKNMVATRAELANYVVDVDDEDCPDPQLHLAAFHGDVGAIKSILEQEPHKKFINARVRPFLATPLRLASTGTRGNLTLS